MGNFNCCSCNTTKSKRGKSQLKKMQLERKARSSADEDEDIEIQDAIDELRELFDLEKDSDGKITAEQCKTIIRSMDTKFSDHHLEAMIVKIDSFWWGEKKINLPAFLSILETKEPVNAKVDNTCDTIMSPRMRMTGFEKCPICKKMLKTCKEGEVFWLDGCNDFYHIECIRTYIKAKINSTSFPITCANDKCTSNIEVKKCEKFLTKHDYKHLNFMERKWARRSLSDIITCPNPDCSKYFEKEPNMIKYSCSECHQDWCLACRVPYHVDMTCAEFKSELMSQVELPQQPSDKGVEQRTSSKEQGKNNDESQSVEDE